MGFHFDVMVRGRNLSLDRPLFVDVGFFYLPWKQSGKNEPKRVGWIFSSMQVHCISRRHSCPRQHYPPKVKFSRCTCQPMSKGQHVYFYLLIQVILYSPTMVCVRTLEGEKDGHTHKKPAYRKLSTVSLRPSFWRSYDMKTPGFFGVRSPSFSQGF